MLDILDKQVLCVCLSLSTHDFVNCLSVSLCFCLSVCTLSWLALTFQLASTSSIACMNEYLTLQSVDSSRPELLISRRTTTQLTNQTTTSRPWPSLRFVVTFSDFWHFLGTICPHKTPLHVYLAEEHNHTAANLSHGREWTWLNLYSFLSYLSKRVKFVLLVCLLVRWLACWLVCSFLNDIHTQASTLAMQCQRFTYTVPSTLHIGHSNKQSMSQTAALVQLPPFVNRHATLATLLHIST